jgi:hypothetical protein
MNFTLGMFNLDMRMRFYKRITFSIGNNSNSITFIISDFNNDDRWNIPVTNDGILLRYNNEISIT